MPSEFQTSLARAFGERLDASVVQVTAAVEDDRLDPGLLGGGGELLADLLRLLALVALEALEGGPGGAGERPATRVVDELREDAAVRAEDGEARALGSTGDLAAHATGAAQTHVARGAD